MNKKLTIIFDNAPSMHKEGIIEEISEISEIIILHLAALNDYEHPSKIYLKKLSFNQSRFVINPKLNNVKIKKEIDIIFSKIRTKNNHYDSIEIIYSFLDLRRLFLVNYLKKILNNQTEKISLIIHLEPIRLDDYFYILRIIKISTSLIFQKIFLGTKQIFLFSSLNSLFYKLFFKKIFIIPYKQTKFVISSSKNIIKKKNNKQFSVLFIGQLIHRKNPFLLIDACNSLKFDINLTLLGTGPLQKKIFKYLKRIKKSKFLQLNFLENIENDKIPLFISSFDVIVLPSKFDGFGFVVSEAINANTYVIASSNVGATDLIIQGKNGSIFNNNSLSELKNQLNLHYLRLKKFYL